MIAARRRIVLGIGSAALGWPLAIWPQPKKQVRIGYLANSMNLKAPTPTYKAFVQTLEKLGWIEGKNLEMVVKSAGNREELFPKLAEEMVRENLDVIVTGGTPATRAAIAATRTIPIVFGSAQTPVEQKFVTSLARPGGNVTGLAVMVQELGPKRLQLLKEILPGAKRIVRLYQTGNNSAESNAAIEKDDNAAARSLGLQLKHVGVDNEKEIEDALSEAAKTRVDAINVKADGLLNSHRAKIVKFALAPEHRIATMGADDRFAEAGGLVSYGENYPARYERAAFLVDKILRGTKPADIPVEQPATFELVINRTTAKALGVAIPDSVLLQARVIS